MNVSGERKEINSIINNNDVKKAWTALGHLNFFYRKVTDIKGSEAYGISENEEYEAWHGIYYLDRLIFLLNEITSCPTKDAVDGVLNNEELIKQLRSTAKLEALSNAPTRRVHDTQQARENSAVIRKTINSIQEIIDDSEWIKLPQKRDRVRQLVADLKAEIDPMVLDEATEKALNDLSSYVKSPSTVMIFPRRSNPSIELTTEGWLSARKAIAILNRFIDKVMSYPIKTKESTTGFTASDAVNGLLNGARFGVTTGNADQDKAENAKLNEKIDELCACLIKVSNERSQLESERDKVKAKLELLNSIALKIPDKEVLEALECVRRFVITHI